MPLIIDHEAADNEWSVRIAGDEIIPNTLAVAEYDRFYIQMLGDFTVYDEDEDEEEVFLYTIEREEFFEVRRDELLDASTSSWTISSMLTAMGVCPACQAVMTPRISESLEEEITRDISRGNRSVVPLIITLHLFTTPEEIESMQDVVPNRPASAAAIERLKATILEEDKGSCVICMDDMMVGVEGIMMMPCNHVYHSLCIRRWLRKSSVCPQCRFSIEDAKPTP